MRTLDTRAERSRLKYAVFIEGGTFRDASLPERVHIEWRDEDPVPDIEDNALLEENAKESFQTLVIDVPSGVDIDEPLHLFFTPGDSIAQRVVLRLGENASIRVYEFDYAQSAVTMNHVVKADIASGASLHYTVLSDYPADASVTVHRLMRLARAASLSYGSAQFGDSRAFEAGIVHLEGQNAYAEVNAVGVTDRRQEVVFNTEIRHRAPASEGRIAHYGVAGAESFLAFEGAGAIEKGNAGSIARQINRGIVLGDKARIDATPLLYIDEHDVEASHGAAIGQMDEEQLYYLMSRGLDETAAQRLIIRGFLQPLDEMLQDETFERHIQARLSEKIE